MHHFAVLPRNTTLPINSTIKRGTYHTRPWSACTKLMKLLMLMMFFMAFHRFIVLVAVHHGSWSLDPSLDPHVPLVQQSNLSKFLYLFRNHAQLCSAFFLVHVPWSCRMSTLNGTQRSSQLPFFRMQLSSKKWCVILVRFEPDRTERFKMHRVRWFIIMVAKCWPLP